MNIKNSAKPSRYTDKTFYYLEWGKTAGQRIATRIFTYTKPKDQLQKNHNKEALKILEAKRSQMILDQPAIGSGYIPSYKLKSNFLDYYSEYVTKNSRKGNRHLAISLKNFKKFMDKDYIPPIEITEAVCEGFRSYLLQNLNGETPADYYYNSKKYLRLPKQMATF